MTSTFRQQPPPVTDTAQLTMPSMTSFKLPSGMNVTLYPHCEADVSYISLIRQGGNAEATSPAVAVLAGGLISEGTASFDSETIADTLDRNGAWLSTSTTAHHRKLSLFTLNSRLQQVLPILSEIIESPAFPEDIVKTRSEILARNIEVSEHDVNYLAHCLSDKMIMGSNHPLARVDSPADILQLSAHDLKKFHSRYNSAIGSHLFICGKVYDSLLNQIISAVNRLPNVTSSPLSITPFLPMPAGSRLTSPLDHATQSAVVINLPAIPRNHPDYIPLHLTVTALGGYFGSRLMTNIREEKGLTYGIRASLLGMHDSSHIEISAETTPDSAELLINEVASELKSLATCPPNSEEMLRIRRAATASMRSLIDNAFGPIDFRMTMLTSNIPQEYFDAKIQAIKTLTPDTISRMAATYLNPDNMLTAISGPSA